MIYTLEKRHEFGNGEMTTYFEVRSYTHRSNIGALMNGKTLKKGSKKQCETYIRKTGISISE